MTGNVRERTRELVRAEIAEIAARAFAEHGFERTTVDDAAREAGISRATFFRYFGSKEEAVIATVQSSGIDFGALLREQAREHTAGESAWSLLTRVFETGIMSIDRDPVQLRARTRMIMQTPSLRSHLSERRRAQEQGLVVALVDRGVDPLTSRVLSVTAFAAYELTWREWAARDTAELLTVFHDIFARVPLLAEPAATPGTGER